MGQAGRAVLTSIAIGILTVNILAANNLRDRAFGSNGRACKRIAVGPVSGEEKTRRLFAVSKHGGFRDRRLARDPATPWALLE